MTVTTTTTVEAEIDRHQLVLLLRDLENFRKDICIRVYGRNGAITKHFSNVLVFAPHAIIMNHMPTRSVGYIPSAGDVIGFEINKPYNDIVPFRRYAVRSSFGPSEIKQGGFKDG